MQIGSLDGRSGIDEQSFSFSGFIMMNSNHVFGLAEDDIFRDRPKMYCLLLKILIEQKVRKNF